MKRLSKVALWASLAAFVLIWSYCWTHVGQSQPRSHAIRRFGVFDRGRLAFEIYGYDVAMNQGSRWVMFYAPDGSLIARLNVDSGLIWKELPR